MAGHVLRAPVVEADTSFAIRILREASDYLNMIARQLKADDLKDIYGGKTVFENILQYEEGKYPLDEMRHAAAYLLINQLLFYHVLSRVDASFKAVDEEKIGKPADLAQYFEPVLKRDYSSIFGFDVASRLPMDATEVVKKVVMVVKALAPEKIRHDVLGKVFHELIPFETRKAVAAFYTNTEAAEILAQLAIDKPDAKVMDLAVGSGTLLVAAYRKKRKLLQKVKGTIELEDHKRFLEQDLTGIDIMPFAAHLAVVHLSLQALLYETERVRIAVWDSTELKPGQVIPAVSIALKEAYKRPTLDVFMTEVPFSQEAYVKKGVITLEGIGGEQIPLEQADVVIMNPPFTRQERLPKSYKDKLAERLMEYEKYIHGQLGLYGYFFLLADRFVKPGGRLALVLPARFIRALSTKKIRKLLANNYHVEYIISTWQRAAFSESAQYREILLVAKKLRESEVEGISDGLACKIVALKTLPKDLAEAKFFVTTMKSVKATNYTDKNIMVSVLNQEELKKNVKNWFIYVSAFDLDTNNLWMNIQKRGSGRLISLAQHLKESNGKILRGVETKSSFGFPFYDAFIVREEPRAKKTHDVWVAEKITKDHVIVRHRFTNQLTTIPLKALQPAIRRASGMSIMELSECFDYVLIDEFYDIEGFFSSKKITENFKHNVKKWNKYVKSRIANFLISRRFDISATGTFHLAWYSSIPITGQNLWSIKGVSDEDLKLLTLWFNSAINILQLHLNRTETRGAWMELNEYGLKDLLIINIKTLSENERKTLVNLFDKIKNTAFPSLLNQLKERFPVRVEVDGAILRVLGFGDDEISRILDYLYPALANEVQQPTNLMQG